MTAATLKNFPKVLLAPVPLPLIQPALARIVHKIRSQHPEIFVRLGTNAKKTFLIAPTNLPFYLLLKPDPDALQLHACRISRLPSYDAAIRGSFMNLLRLIDGRMDGDAIFFSRALQIEGDTEAIVSLRNALDNIEGSLAESVAGFFGRPGRFGLSLLRKVQPNEMR